MKKILYFLRYQLLVIKHCYKYLLVHKPLCDKYKDNTLLLFNKIYICRGCFYIYLGIFLSITANTFIHSNYINYLLFFIPLVILLSYPKIYKKFPRLIKDFIRFFGGVIIAQSFIFSIKINLVSGLFILVVIFLFNNFFNTIRKNKAHNACINCPEYKENKICSGYSEQIEKIRLVEEEFCKNNLKFNGR